MTEGQPPAPQGKPQITFNRPSSPGSGVMLGAVGLAIGSALVYAVLANTGGPSDSYMSTPVEDVGSPTEDFWLSADDAAVVAAEAAAAAEAASVSDFAADATAHAGIQGAKDAVAAGALTEDQLNRGVQGSVDAIAAADAADPAGTATQATIQLNGVAVMLSPSAAWRSGQSGRQWMFLHSEANVVCQLTARADATPGGVQKDAGSDEAQYENDFISQMLPVPGATRSAKLLYREVGSAEYRYGVLVRLSVPEQGSVTSLAFVNALAQQSTKMARLQCAPRDMRRAADMTPAEQLARTLHVE